MDQSSESEPQQLCETESQGDHPGLPVPNTVIVHSLCGRKATVNKPMKIPDCQRGSLATLILNISPEPGEATAMHNAVLLTVISDSSFAEQNTGSLTFLQEL